MTDDLEERQARLAAILQHSAELTQRTEEMLAEPRPVMTYEPPRQVRTRDAERIEHEVDKRLLAIEARLSLRMDALEGSLASLRNGVEGLADEAGGALGQAERKLRKEVESLRGEVTLLRSPRPVRRGAGDSQATTPARRKPISRAPFSLEDDNAALRN